MKTNKTGNAGANDIGAKTYENPRKDNIDNSIIKWYYSKVDKKHQKTLEEISLT